MQLIKNKWLKPKEKKDMTCLNYTLQLKLYPFILKCYQQYQNSTHVCNVCGSPFDENQIDMMQQNQMSSMQEVEYDINCPIHGQQRPQ